MTLKTAWAWIKAAPGRFWAWVKRPWRLAHEARVEGGTALYAVAQDSPEGDIQAAKQRDAWTTQIARIEDIENRDLAQELLLRQLRRNVRDLDHAEARRHATPQSLGGQRLSAFGAVGAANPLLGLAMNPMTWAVLGLVGLGGMNALTGWRLDHAKHDLGEVRHELSNTQRDLRERTQERDVAMAAVQDARASAQQTTANLEAERAHRARAAATERRRQREIQNVLTGRDPPAWSLHDTGTPASDDSAAAPGDPG